MKTSLLKNLVALGAGALFAFGLALGGMTDPAKVIGFLDVSGNWDPSLAFVMAGALGVFVVGSLLARRRGKPVVGEVLEEPEAGKIDARLLIGAAMFGIGWGLAGICPGPGIASVAGGSLAVVTFVGAMLGGQVLFEVTLWRPQLKARLAAQAAEAEAAGEARPKTAPASSLPVCG